MTRRRARGAGEGTIYQRKDGRWHASLTVGSGPDGRQLRRHVYGKTRAEAARKLAELQVQHHRGAAVRHGRVSLIVYLRAFARARGAYVRPSTAINHARYLDIVARQPTVAEMPLGDLRARHAEALYAAAAREYSDSVVAHLRIFVNQALKDAIKNEVLGNASALQAQAPRRERTVAARALTPEESARLVAAAGGKRLEVLLRTLLALGLRIGEALALEWGDYDAPAGTLRVERTLSLAGGQRVTGPTKTRAGRRTLYVSPPLAARWAAWREVTRAEAELTGYAPNTLIFPNMHGRPAQYNLIRREFMRVAERAGLSGLRLHDLRHTFATRLILGGADPRTVAALLGHTDSRVTLAIYAHAHAETNKAALMLLADDDAPGSEPGGG